MASVRAGSPGHREDRHRRITPREHVSQAALQLVLNFRNELSVFGAGCALLPDATVPLDVGRCSSLGHVARAHMPLERVDLESELGHLSTGARTS